QPFAVRHLLVGENHVVVVGEKCPAGLLKVASLPDFVLVLAQVRGQDSPHVRLIIDDQDFTHVLAYSLFAPLHLRQAVSWKSKFARGCSRPESTRRPGLVRCCARSPSRVPCLSAG